MSLDFDLRPYVCPETWPYSNHCVKHSSDSKHLQGDVMSLQQCSTLVYVEEMACLKHVLAVVVQDLETPSQGSRLPRTESNARHRQ